MRIMLTNKRCGGKMHDLSYFNLGFRSESVSNFLEELKIKRSNPTSLLDDAFLIIKDCLKVREGGALISSFSGAMGKKGYEEYTLLPLLAELYLNSNIDSIISELKTVYETIVKIRKDSGSASADEYDGAIDFFSSLSDLCLSNSIHQINSEKLKFA